MVRPPTGNSNDPQLMISGGVELLDDLDDHWTAKNHKAERNEVGLASKTSGYR